MSEFIYFPTKEELLKQIRRLMKAHKITQEDLAFNTKIPQEKISKMIGKTKRKQELKYEDAQKIYNSLLRLLSPFKDEPISKIATKSEDVEKEKGIIELDQTVSEAAEKMAKKGFTQLIVKDKKGNYVGIITDSILLNRMMHPSEKYADWFKRLGEQTIKESKLCDRVTPYPDNSTQKDVAQVLTLHYGIAILEGNEKYGIVTRNDFMELLCDKVEENKLP